MFGQTGQAKRKKNGMKALPVVAATLALAFAQAAFAGAPLKGVGVSLGKSPGGSCAARTTGADGTADFGVWPKGNYTITFDPLHGSVDLPSGMAWGRIGPNAAPAKLHYVITGASAGRLERDLPTGQAAGRVAPLEFSLDGKQKLVVVVSVAD